MRLERDDLEAAVTAGVIPQAQADALVAFVAEQQRSRFAEGGQEDESFRFMTGFNDFFFAIGIVLLGSGIAFFTAGGLDTWPRIVAAAIMWGLSELLVRKMRLVLPGILLSIFFIVFVYLAVPVDLLPIMQAQVPRFPFTNPVYYHLFGLNGAPAIAMVKAVIGAGAAGLYYWRFRLPFALLPTAASLVLFIAAAIQYATGQPTIMVNALIILACGLAVFAAAMRYDLSDRERVTRRSDCAFWLHLLAAPLIVHSLIALVTPNYIEFANAAVAAILLTVAALAVIAIAIDRRALLVAALLYVGFVIAYAIGGSSLWAGRATATDRSLVFFGTLVILGIFVIVVGIGWMPLRRGLMRLISPSIANRLPPVPSRA
jgi:hypothetical protein